MIMRGTKMTRALALLAGLVLAAIITGPVAAQTKFETSAKQAILIDFDTRAILFEKEPDTTMFPASMTKIMTALLVFDRLRDGSFTLDTKLPVSEKAWRMGGSKMFVKVGDEVTVEDLLRGVIVQSGNDASIVFAEAISGSEEAFGELMTKRGEEIGLEGTVFRNSTGWPDPDHVTTPRDMAKLAEYVIREFPDNYKYYSEREFTYGKSLDGKPIVQSNRNPLLYQGVGADGLKTGHTEAAGFGLTASGERKGRRLIMVIHGMDSVRTRSQESRRLFDWGFREFTNVALFKAGEPVETANVWLGDKPSVQLMLEEDFTVTLPRGARTGMKVTVKYQGPIQSPIAKGQQVATLEIIGPGFEPISRPLLAAEDIGQKAFFGRIGSAISFIIFGAPSG
ncbi:MAG: D-alanyl-D-alanine carboxypeptidase [Alphaproteobacteria bacterium]|nr:D-alanyl-D-alanine carboxypeptidase [Alphaproteobacteria bacterium]